MKLYFQYSHSHEVFVQKYFLPTVGDQFQLCGTYDPTQPCLTGEFKTEGWMAAVGAKARTWANACKENEGDVIACSDVDVQFFGLTADWLMNSLPNKADVVFQESQGKGVKQQPVCTGFFVMRCNERMFELWDTVATQLETQQVNDDQYGVNQYVGQRFGKLNWLLFSSDFIWSPGFYDHVDDLKPPATMLLHHANYVVGIAGKIEQLNHVKQLVKRGIDG